MRTLSKRIFTKKLGWVIVSGRAYSYQKKESGYVNKIRISFTVPFSSGSLMSTASDMLLCQNTWIKNLLLNSKMFNKAFPLSKLNNDQEFGCGYGWHLKEMNGMTLRTHGACIFGFKTMGVYLPSEDIYVIGKSACDCNSLPQVGLDVAFLTLKQLKK